MHGSRIGRLLPIALLMTATVVLLPALLVMAIPSRVSPWVGVPLCVGLSLVISRAAAALWQRSSHSSEILFADLMLWGWLRRLRTERRLARAYSLVQDTMGGADQQVLALARVSALLEARDAYTRRHSLRVTRHCEAIAHGLELDEEEVARVRTAAALHDVGKVFTPRQILNKPGSLTDAEFAVIKRHPGQGADMLDGMVEPSTGAMIRYHHERLDGAGYPEGLAGDEIPMGARIIAVADTFDAITSTRTYRSARPHAEALTILREEAGDRLDPRAVAAFEGYYYARRETLFSGLVSGMTQALAPLRELLVPVSRALPTLGAAAVVAVPLLGAAANAGPDRGAGGRQQRAAGKSGVAAVPAADRTRSGRTAATAGRRRNVSHRSAGGGAPSSRGATSAPSGTAPQTTAHPAPGAAPPSSPAAKLPPASAVSDHAPASAPPGGAGGNATEDPAAPPGPEPAASEQTAPVSLPAVDVPALPELPDLPEVPEVDLPDLPVAVPTH